MEASEKNIQPRKEPTNYEAEKSLLSCMLLEHDAAVAAMSRLTKDYIYNTVNRRIFEAIESIAERGKNIRLVTVYDVLKSGGDTEFDFLEYLTELTNQEATAAFIDDYIAIIERDYILRRVIKICGTVADEAYKADGEAGAVVTHAIEQFHELSVNRGQQLAHIRDSIIKFYEELAKKQKDSNYGRGFPSGFHKLDQFTNGFTEGQLVIVAARPSVGKTAFALNFLANIAKRQAAQDKSKKSLCALFELEMTGEDLAQRMISNLSNVPMNNLKRGDSITSDEFLNSYKISNDLLINSQIYHSTGTNTKPSQIYELCTKLADDTGKKLDIVLVDYLGLLELEESDKRRNSSTVQELAKITRALKLYAMKLKCPIILLCQMSRAIEKREQELKSYKSGAGAADGDSGISPMPQLSDLRDSGSIEQDADIVIFLSKKLREKESNEIIMTIAKNRSGETGEIFFNFDGRHQRFTEGQVFHRGASVGKPNDGVDE
ncbi:MAG: hypothetical protein LBN25_00080 [Christensenellaceae bacterium]|jgi:replicative DNA helicase|nr:hypothetical protein [Christensenellaceae bacterium]